jgi:hypothetical protein
MFYYLIILDTVTLVMLGEEYAILHTLQNKSYWNGAEWHHNLIYNEWVYHYGIGYYVNKTATIFRYVKRFYKEFYKQHAIK